MRLSLAPTNPHMGSGLQWRLSPQNWGSYLAQFLPKPSPVVNSRGAEGAERAPEARGSRRLRRGGGCGRGYPLPRQLGGLGERCKLPQWGPGRSPGRFRFFDIFILNFKPIVCYKLVKMLMIYFLINTDFVLYFFIWIRFVALEDGLLWVCAGVRVLLCYVDLYKDFYLVTKSSYDQITFRVCA